MASMTDQHVLVVGGSGTIGSAVARMALREGARVTVTASTRQSLDDTVSRLDGAGGVVCDITEHGASDALADQVEPVDHLAITAAALTFDGLLDGDPEALSALIATKVWGALHICRAFGRRLGEGDSITLVSGMLSRRPAMAAPLAAVNGFTESLGRGLAVELAPVRVNVVSPAALGESGYLEHEGTADDVAQCFHVAMTNAWMSGSVLDVHGAGIF